ncbi:hypothetical protein BC628DRAFT_139035 [Trametes gibbosa]|nr:hypothetical protein BC628DRAFT_139035 [Trametes gibbosa]
MKRLTIHRRFSSCAETCLSQANCLPTSPRGGTACTCEDPAGAIQCFSVDQCPGADLTKLSRELDLCNSEPSVTDSIIGIFTGENPDTPTPSPTMPSTTMSPTGTPIDTRPFSNSIGSTTTPKLFESLSLSEPRPTFGTSSIPLLSTGPSLTSSRRPTSSLPLPSSIASSSSALSANASTFVLTSPSISASVHATSLATSTTPSGSSSPSTSLIVTETGASHTSHGPRSRLVIALSTSCSLVLFIVVAAAVVILRRRQRGDGQAAARDTPQAIARISRELRGGNESTSIVDAKVEPCTRERGFGMLQASGGAALLPPEPGPALVDAADATGDGDAGMVGRQDATGPSPSTMGTLCADEASKVMATAESESEPQPQPQPQPQPAAPPLPSVLSGGGARQDDPPPFVTSETALASVRVQRARRFVTVWMEVEDGEGEGGFGTERPPPPPYQPRIHGDPGNSS